MRQKAEDQFRRGIARTSTLGPGVLDLDLTDRPEPVRRTAQHRHPDGAGSRYCERPELEAVHQQLASDELSIRLAHNNLKPTSKSLGSILGKRAEWQRSWRSEYRDRHELGASLFRFAFPAYGANALVGPADKESQRGGKSGRFAGEGRRRDQYQRKRDESEISLDVTTAVHSLEAAKLGMEAAKVAVDLAKDTLRAVRAKNTIGS